MLRGAPGRRRIKPRSVSTTIMRWAVGGVTWKYCLEVGFRRRAAVQLGVGVDERQVLPCVSVKGAVIGCVWACAVISLTAEARR